LIAVFCFCSGFLGLCEEDAGTGGGTDGSIKTTLTPTNATLSDGAKVEKILGNTQVSLKITGTSVTDDCTTVAGSYNFGISSDGAGTSKVYMAGSYTPVANTTVSDVDLRLNTVASPTGDIFVSIASDNAGDPGTVMGSTNPVNAAIIGGDALYNFAFATPVSLTAGTTYHFVFQGDSMTYSAPGTTDKIRWGDTPPGNCGSVPVGITRGSNDGMSWTNLNGSNIIRIAVNSPNYATDSPYATYTLDAASSKTWDLSTFLVDENPSGEAGTLTYDVGASATSSPVYDYTAQSMAGIQAAADLTGQYLHIKAIFTSSGTEDATIGDIEIFYD